ncbi:ribosomal protection-like ABC-F family protein [Aliarcobacter butzleri]|uniref:ABC-F family ATP-binding cassette domain-containing protein n=1 Tax=Aliarcobacter butzleri TaxID=28197 RepID=A0AAP4PAK9_9BACT|nr:ABC-F family ATP-binding cassette domain-containing protein [Aliarcobacter butzleri]MDN5052466.1 ABC-F family ATP-binding cassette domain-containing protein [Aliarcobacter butzleri]MDN5060871.1 ABC-F family ATP-binding cassette domain-containing protein [Aliarcobacter butzleri]MDN5075038.1 ABC-F family ATP-binding cassette domain-containing protein [Aliarcobacter butzleri]MDN5116630.1 ABC-F family ATP-binding cassette domain-containing protein [Aliarcobacter butzleri]MDN5132660.1 ABC-F fami
MALIDLQNISKQYDTKVILKDVNFTLNSGQRIAVIGQNGQGKSTLFKIIMRTVEPDSGEMAIDKSIKIEMLDQQPKFKANLTVREAIENQLTELKTAKVEYEKITNELMTNYEDENLLRKQSELASFLEFHNAWDLDNMIERVLIEFQLKEYELKDVNLLSGGEQRRVSLAGLILKKPDVLLLDEPTNHLDVYMVEFLEQLLLKNNFTLLFISHDRYFIDNIATSVVEVDGGTLRKFNGGYSSYLEQKAQILENMQKEHENLLRMVKREAHWMQHGVTARRKRNERRKSEYFDLKQKARSNPAMIRKMSLELQREQKSFNGEEKQQNRKKMLYELDNVYKSLGEKELIKDFTTRILQKDTIAIVGPNGSGKSTLLKIFMEKLKIDKGTFKKGDFNIGYFDQQRDMLDDNKNLMETFCPNGGDRVILDDGRNMHVFGYLKNFLFPREYLDKKVGVLSGGEKNRVALALLFTKKVDCLILDEPTNDLDIPTINILEEYLQNFQGALIFVSHDRYFVDKIAKKLFVFQGNGHIMESFQPYSEYLEIEKELKELDSLEFDIEKEKTSVQVPQQTKKQTKLSYKDQREYDLLPKEIEELESKLEEINNCLANPKCYEQKGIVAISKELEETKELYELKVERFLELEELVESFNS